MAKNRGYALFVLVAVIIPGLYLCSAQGVSAAAKGPRVNGAGSHSSTGCAGSSINVTTIVADSDNNGALFQLQSDGKGPYTTIASNTDSVTSEIQANSCDWLFDTTASTSRAITLTLSYQASSPSVPPPFTTATPVTSRVISKCGLNSANNGTSYGTMTFAGQTLQCELSIGVISYKGNTYGVRFEPNNFAGTTWVQVTCTGAVSSHCNSWTVTPIGNAVVDPYTGQTSAIGELVQVSTSRGKTIERPMGLYYVAFSVTIHE